MENTMTNNTTRWNLEGAEPRTEKGVSIYIVNNYDEVTGWNRDTQLVGPDGKEYRLVLSYVEWNGFDSPDWYDVDGVEIETPDWAENLSAFDLDTLTVGE